MKTGFSGTVAQGFLNSKLTPLLIGASIVAGLGGLLTTPREEEPQILVPMIDVAVGLPGASPREVERRILEPLERSIWENRSDGCGSAEPFHRRHREPKTSTFGLRS